MSRIKLFLLAKPLFRLSIRIHAPATSFEIFGMDCYLIQSTQHTSNKILRNMISRKVAIIVTLYCRQTSKISHSLVNNIIVDHSDVCACRCCSNYIFILDLTPGFDELGKDSCKTRRSAQKVYELIEWYRSSVWAISEDRLIVIMLTWHIVFKQVVPWSYECITTRSTVHTTSKLEAIGQIKTRRKTSNISRTLVGNKIVDHSDVVGASPVGAAPTTSSFSTKHPASRNSEWTAARHHDNLLSVEILCALY